MADKQGLRPHRSAHPSGAKSSDKQDRLDSGRGMRKKGHR